MTSSPATPAELRVIPSRKAATHKGDYGRLLIVGGCVGMHGAPVLAAQGALSSGAGLVTIALPAAIYPIAGALEARATYLPVGDARQGHFTAADLGPLLEAARKASVVALGPGIGVHRDTVELVRNLVHQLPRPLVLDADGLNAFADEPALIGGPRPATIITPHPGEAQRLTGRACGSEDAERRATAVDLALRVAGVVVLKGHRSVITDGMAVHCNATGNPGMATGGMGDVLTGCVAAILAILPDPLLSSRVAAHAHGLAGDRAADKLGEVGITTTEVLAELPGALRAMTGA